jgi:hypothetical protein
MDDSQAKGGQGKAMTAVECLPQKACCQKLQLETLSLVQQLLRHLLMVKSEIRENALADGVCQITGLGFASSIDFNLLSLFYGTGNFSRHFNPLEEYLLSGV